MGGARLPKTLSGGKEDPMDTKEHTIVLKVGSSDFAIIQKACHIYQRLQEHESNIAKLQGLAITGVCHTYMLFLEVGFRHASFSKEGVSAEALVDVLAMLKKKR